AIGRIALVMELFFVFFRRKKACPAFLSGNKYNGLSY
ncbi:MAG: hypothetical protein ACI85O_002448, partial [Saprospiraceae bacterium]